MSYNGNPDHDMRRLGAKQAVTDGLIDIAKSMVERDARIRTLETELAEYKEAVRVLGKSVADVRSDVDWPSLTNTMVAGLFCGVEDRDLRDRYDGARYGYEDALDRCHEFIQNATVDALNNPIAKAAIEGSNHAQG